MKIRQADKKDLPQLKKLCLEAHKELAKFSEDITVNKKTESEVNREMDSILKDPFTKVLLAEEDDRIIGNIYIFFAPGLRREGTISNLFVIKSQRKKGVASKLMATAIEWLQKRGLKRIRMVVHKKNRTALSFLKKFGFKKEPIKVFWLIKSI